MAYRDFGNDINLALERMQRLRKFQLLHNELRKDFIRLYDITLAAIEKGNESPELIRSCLREYFSLVEADIFYLNYLEPYKDYDDRHAILDKFKDTYKAHCQFHNKKELYRKFTDSFFADLNTLKNKRDNITHPKNKDEITVDKSVLEMTYSSFVAYTKFVNDAMADTGIQFQIKDLMTLKMLKGG